MRPQANSQKELVLGAGWVPYRARLCVCLCVCVSKAVAHSSHDSAASRGSLDAPSESADTLGDVSIRSVLLCARRRELPRDATLQVIAFWLPLRTVPYVWHVCAFGCICSEESQSIYEQKIQAKMSAKEKKKVG